MVHEVQMPSPDGWRSGWGFKDVSCCTICFSTADLTYWCYTRCERQYCLYCCAGRPCVLCQEEDAHGP